MQTSIATTNLPLQKTPLNNPSSNITNFTQKSILNLLNTKCPASLQCIKQIHAIVLKHAHLFQDYFVYGTLVKSYANPHFNNLDFALEVFDFMSNPNHYVYNVVIEACVQNDEPLKALLCYYDMVVSCSSRPNKFTYPNLFKACWVENAVKEGVQLHTHVVKYGVSGDGHVRSAGIRMYAGFGCLEEARRLLDEEGTSDVVCANAMLDGYLKCGEVEKAKELFEGIEEKSVATWNIMVRGLAKCGAIEEARGLFDEMKERDEISWSVMVDGYVKGKCFKEALKVYDLMRRERVRPGKFVLSSLLAACANLGALDQGKGIHAYVKKNSLHLDSILGTALVDMYAKCGRPDMAWDVFEKMKNKAVDCWNAMISGLGMHGRGEEAIELYLKMQQEKFRPDRVTFVGVLNACAHAGAVDEGLKILNSMKHGYGVEPDLEHYGCMVDLFGRAGHLAEAEKFVSSMPIEPNAAVWGALLGACRKHGDVELGEKVGKILLELEPQNSGRYAMLSSIYAKTDRWEDVANLRKTMKERGVKTQASSSLIELNGVVNGFTMGDTSHPQMKEVHLMLKTIIERLEMEGYAPNTSQVLVDASEEEKASALQYHSEKLAIAYGFINTIPRTSIRMVRTLRMCADCHLAIKLISQVYSRDIIVRDRVRYHHFRNGSCSCKDCW